MIHEFAAKTIKTKEKRKGGNCINMTLFLSSSLRRGGRKKPEMEVNDSEKGTETLVGKKKN